MVNVRKRGKSYEYRFEVASIDGTRKWIMRWNPFARHKESMI